MIRPTTKGNGKSTSFTDDLMEPPGTSYSQNSQNGSIGGVLAFIVLSIAVFGTIGFMYLAFTDHMNGIDAWREKAVRDQRDGYRKVCEDNFDRFEKLKEYLNKKKADSPPEYVIDKNCVQPDADLLNKPKED